jgi:hypothetical protein
MNNFTSTEINIYYNKSSYLLYILYFFYGVAFYYNTNIKQNEDVVVEVIKEDIVEVIVKEEIKYEDKYLKKYERMCSSQVTKDEDKEDKEDKEEEEEKKKKEQEKEAKFKNNIVMENTPQGNVIMFYDTKRNSFIYYSDHTIPYRYLEVVGRKYVTTYNCCDIFFNMKQEIENAERKIAVDKQKVADEQKVALAIEVAEQKVAEQNKEMKPNVFAKLKNYNTNTTNTNNVKGNSKNVGSRTVSTNNISSNSSSTMILKENANRYSYEGKLANYTFLKKPERKVVDKSYGFSFADFKNMQEKKMQ